MAATGGVRVRGLKETVRAFNAIDENLSEELRDGLKKAAEPVRALAQTRGLETIGNMRRSPAWAEQKTVVSKRTALVYVAPAKRQTRIASRKRKNLATMMMQRAMEPALQQNEERVRAEVEDVLDTLGRKNGF